MEPRLIVSNDTRPNLYELLAQTHAEHHQANDYRRAYRRHHWFLAALAWVGESNWRIVAMIVAALLIGSVAELVLP
jgi:hypothetical protein